VGSREKNLDVRYAGNYIEGKELIAATLDRNIGEIPYARQDENDDDKGKVRFVP
jgi:hypothetical protein